MCDNIKDWWKQRFGPLAIHSINSQDGRKDGKRKHNTDVVVCGICSNNNNVSNVSTNHPQSKCITIGKTCNHCGKKDPNHHWNNCYRNPANAKATANSVVRQGGGGKKFKIDKRDKCSYCHKPGHSEAVCFKKKKDKGCPKCGSREIHHNWDECNGTTAVANTLVIDMRITEI